MRVLLLTWNVGNAPPVEEEVRAALLASADCDMVVVGTQENSYSLSAAAKAKAKANRDDAEEDDDDLDERSEGMARSPPIAAAAAATPPPPPPESDGTMAEWESLVHRCLGAPSWGLVKLVTLWEMRLCVFARTEHLAGGEHAAIHHVRAARSATGFASVLGNKGGLVVTLQFGGTSLCFVSCHLAAHSHKVAARNANLQEILRETRAASGRADLDVAHAADHTFWMGDLNYRLDPRADLPPSAARASVATSPAAAAGREAPEAPAAVFEVVVPDDLEAGGGGDGGDDAATTTVAARCSVGGAARPQLRRGAGAAASGKLELTSARSETAALKKDYYHRQDEQNGLVLAKVNARDWGGLMRWDQLRASQAAGEAFAGFVEGPIDFPPTFKVQRRRGLTYKDQRVLVLRSHPLAFDARPRRRRHPVDLPGAAGGLDVGPQAGGATFAIATAAAAAAGGEGGAHDGGGGDGGGGEPRRGGSTCAGCS